MPEGVLRISGPVMLEQEPFYGFLSAFLKDSAETGKVNEKRVA